MVARPRADQEEVIVPARIDHHCPAEYVSVPVVWPAPTDLSAEVMANALLATPVASRQYVRGLERALNESTTTDELITALYETGAYFGGHGAPEAAGLLWDTAAAVQDSVYESELSR
jgi:hypothetical protein